MDMEIDEAVRVWAFFDRKIFPIAMNWRRRYIKFDKTILMTIRRVGDVRMVDLICVGEGANYQLEYNSSNYLWKVKRVMEKD